MEIRGDSRNPSKSPVNKTIPRTYIAGEEPSNNKAEKYPYELPLPHKVFL
jgi:hypothetical protein